MGELYDRIASLCSNKGIKPGKMCNDLGISRGSIGDLKKGRREGISIKTATKIADYFGVTTDYLLTGEEIKKAPTPEGRCLCSCAQLERIMRSLANSPPLAIWNLASRSLTCRFFFSSPDTS